MRDSAMHDPAGPLRVGLLGAGMIASFDWGILPGSRHLRPGVLITAIAAPSAAHAEGLAREYGVPHVYRSLDDMLDGDEVDAVVNITPIPLHAATSRAILRAGKHLVTEKPLASTLAEADELIAIAEGNGLLIVSSPPRMLEPARILARDLVVRGAIGTVAFARVRSSHAGPAAQAWPTDPSWYYRADAGPLLDMGVYGIQEITGILGPARAVTAVGSRTSATRTAAGGPFDGVVVPVGADDNVIVILHFDAGAYAVVDCTFNVRAARSPEVEIFGHRGTIGLRNARLEPGLPAVELYAVDDGGVRGHWADPTDDDFAARAERVGLLRRAILIDHLAECLETGHAPVLSGDHARHTLEVVLAARESAATGRRVELSTTF